MKALDLSPIKIKTEQKEQLLKIFETMVNQAGKDLISLLIFGSAVSDEYNEEHSNINLILVIKQDSEALFGALRDPLTEMVKRFRISPMIITEEEVLTSADVFPSKFIDIVHNHKVLYGTDPFADLKVRDEHLRLRCEQILKNMSLRMRRLLVTRTDSDFLRREVIHSFLPAFLSTLRMILPLAGQEIIRDRTKLITRGSELFGLDKKLLNTLSALHWDKATITEKNAADLSFSFFQLVVKLASIVDKM